MKNIEIGIKLGFHQTEVLKTGIELSVPSTRRLSEAVESFFEQTDLGFSARLSKALRLVNIHLFKNLPIEKGGLDIEVINGPAMMAADSS